MVIKEYDKPIDEAIIKRINFYLAGLNNSIFEKFRIEREYTDLEDAKKALNAFINRACGDVLRNCRVSSLDGNYDTYFAYTYGNLCELFGIYVKSCRMTINKNNPIYKRVVAKYPVLKPLKLKVGKEFADTGYAVVYEFSDGTQVLIVNGRVHSTICNGKSIGNNNSYAMMALEMYNNGITEEYIHEQIENSYNVEVNHYILSASLEEYAVNLRKKLLNITDAPNNKAENTQKPSKKDTEDTIVNDNSKKPTNSLSEIDMYNQNVMNEISKALLKAHKHKEFEIFEMYAFTERQEAVDHFDSFKEKFAEDVLSKIDYKPKMRDVYKKYIFDSLNILFYIEKYVNIGASEQGVPDQFRVLQNFSATAEKFRKILKDQIREFPPVGC